LWYILSNAVASWSTISCRESRGRRGQFSRLLGSGFTDSGSNSTTLTDPFAENVQDKI
jgi:hypothetical protein